MNKITCTTVGCGLMSKGSNPIGEMQRVLVLLIELAIITRIHLTQRERER